MISPETNAIGSFVKQAMPEDLLEEISSNSHNFLSQEKEATNKKNEYKKIFLLSVHKEYKETNKAWIYIKKHEK